MLFNIFLIGFCIAQVLSESNIPSELNKKALIPTTTTANAKTSTTVTSTTPSAGTTTPTTVTTAAPTTVPTAAPTTVTTVAPTTVTTSAPTTVTTAAPTTVTTTTTTPDTTTQSPDGIPKFFVMDGENVCIIIKANITLFVPYFSSKDEVKSFKVEQSAIVSGHCNKDNESIELSWTPKMSKQSFNVTLIFEKMPAAPSVADTVIVSKITFTYYLSQAVFPGTNETGVRTVSAKGPFFKSPSATGYSCEAQQNITLTETNMPDVQFSASGVHEEAFRNSTTIEFEHTTYDCTSDSKPNNVVPIAVGVSFAILIVLAIVVFFIGNRRRNQGYQSI